MNARNVKTSTLKRANTGCMAALESGNVRKIRRKRLRALYAVLRDLAPPYRAPVVSVARNIRGGAK